MPFVRLGPGGPGNLEIAAALRDFGPARPTVFHAPSLDSFNDSLVPPAKSLFLPGINAGENRKSLASGGIESGEAQNLVGPKKLDTVIMLTMALSFRKELPPFAVSSEHLAVKSLEMSQHDGKKREVYQQVSVTLTDAKLAA